MPAWMRGALALVVALVVGGFAGAAIQRSMDRVARDNPMDSAAFMRSLDRDLALDSAQHAAIVRVFARHQATIDSAWRTVRPAVRAAMDSSQMEIYNVLRPDQRPRFLQLVQAAHPGMNTTMPAR